MCPSQKNPPPPLVIEWWPPYGDQRLNYLTSLYEMFCCLVG